MKIQFFILLLLPFLLLASPLNDTVPTPLNGTIPLNETVPTPISEPLNGTTPSSDTIPAPISEPLNETTPSSDTIPAPISEPLNETTPSSDTIPAPISEPLNETTPSSDTIPAPISGPLNATAPEPLPTPPPTQFDWVFNGSCGTGPIHESIIDGDISRIVTVNDQISFILTTTSSLYRTTDGGVTWIDQAPYMSNFKPTTIVQSINPQQIYIYSSTIFWVTTNGGNTYEKRSVPYFLALLLPHPTQPNMLATIQITGYISNLCFLTFPNCYLLIFSVDGGSSWSDPFNDQTGALLPPYITWGLAGQQNHSNSEFSAIFFEFNEEGDVYPSMWQTTDMFQLTATQPFGELQLAGFLYFSDISGYLLFTNTEPGNLLLANGNLTEYTEAVLPQTKYGSSAQIIDVADVTVGSVFLAVQMEGEPSDTIELAVSDSLGGEFILSLDDVYLLNNQNTFKFDYYKLPNYQGIIVANKWVTLPTIGRTLQSVITLNKGLKWSTLQPPPEESIDCANCTLHLFGSASFTETLYVSVDNDEVGVLLANAMVGTGFVNNISLANLYISRDTGITWSRIRNGAWKFDTSPTSVFIAATEWSGVTDSVFISPDQGLSWNECFFQPNNTGRNHTVARVDASLTKRPNSLWLVTSWTDTTGATGNSIFFMDYDIPTRTCNESDLEYFSPYDVSGECVLGKEIISIRRKQSSVCIMDPTLNTTIIQICNCTRADYTCTSCFLPDTSQPDYPCVAQKISPNCATLWDPTPPPLNCPYGTNYTGNPAYRRIEGTQCVNDIQSLLVNRIVPCPPPPPPPVPEPISIPTAFNVTPSSPTAFNVTPSSPAPQSDGSLQSNTQIQQDNTGYIVLGVVLGLVLIVVIVFALRTYYNKKKEKEKFDELGHEQEEL